MFVQVVRGVVSGPGEAFARLDHWLTHLAPGAHGWLGTTAGVSADGELVSFVRFATADDARHSSDRVEQGQWWAETAGIFTGDVTFDNHDDVHLFGNGGSDAAGVVEALLGRVHRRRGQADLADQLGAAGLGLGPSVIGGLVGVHQDGNFVQAVYFCDPADGPPSGSLDPLAVLGSSTGVSDLRLLRLEHLWFGSPTGAVRREPAGPARG